MSKTTSSSTKSNPTTATTIVTGSTPNTESSNTSYQTTRDYAQLDNISRYRESPSWMEPYYATERMKDREGHRRRIGDVIQGVEDILGLERKRS
ncbi:hypothetical protein BDV38DRAFT_276843 [Aspergillus pseudotamarii]|uniref:Uncharacterized protein n=1 Tax=Aspergillus pseudotamarii TaxID=132259 RepID=A0A5N6TBX1_ASPPS|nr:uncharacterized protein BDV38DRAFT_276843 [Aspergillus pseudotamarii]KAE8143767.1 hypothetical protein BDV38DRAFT_276843 [Aspergillus pseudotamarii]